jgi:threonine dehydratase
MQGIWSTDIIEGAYIGEAKEFAETLVESEGLTYINGYGDPSIMAGVGTMGIDIIDEVPCVDVVVAPIGGAGLIAGVVSSITIRHSCRYISSFVLVNSESTATGGLR